MQLIELLESAANFAAVQQRPHFSVRIEITPSGFLVVAKDTADVNNHRSYQHVVGFYEIDASRINVLNLAIGRAVKGLDRELIVCR
jgi:hypothetical protein